MKQQLTIGVLSKNYAAKRLFLDKLSDARYVDVRPTNYFVWRNLPLLLGMKLHLSHRSPEELVSRLFYDYKAAVPLRCDILHLFNCIDHSSGTPWAISVETAVPYPISVSRTIESDNPDFALLKDDKYVKKRLECLAQDSCKALLPLSRCSYNIQMELLKQFPEYSRKIKNKTLTLHPPQQLLIKNIDEKQLNHNHGEPLRCIFVGRNYFRKGGREAIEVLSELRKDYDFRLTLISNLTVDESKYVLSEHDVEDAKRLIAENSSWIDFYEELPNSEVIAKLKQSHVCLLPTWMDTYAYSVLESQACGTPCITTSLRALTETNGEDVGWSVPVPVNRLNHPLHNNEEQRATFSDSLKKGLRAVVEHVLTHRDEVVEKSENCLKRIARQHDPDVYAQKLRMIYDGRVSELIKEESCGEE